MKIILSILVLLFGGSINAYASEPWGETPRERITNTIDVLSEALCVDAVRDRKKISRETYLKLTMDFMNRMKLDYKHSKMMSEMVVKDAFRKCPENFQR